MIAIIDYGAGNLQSVKKALDYLGEPNLITAKSSEIEAADALVLPGVGSFGDAMQSLTDSGLLGVPPQNLTVAGDNLNDLEMIREFSSFAVSSGRAELKAEANFVAPDIAAIVSHLL